MSKVTFYHAGCSVCISAEQEILTLLDNTKTELEIVNFGDAKERVKEAEELGVKSVPALVSNGQVLHINFGASIEDVKSAVGLV